MIPCRVCGGAAKPLFGAVVLRRHAIEYFRCDRCGFLETEEPHWLAEAYSDAITLQDTGLVARNVAFAERAAILLYFFFARDGKFVDFAGGVGLFTRLMRDIGFDFRTYDPNAPNVLARGFDAGLDEPGVELVTSFESFEHFVQPTTELERMMRMSRNVLFSTELVPSPIPRPEEWWYYGLPHGQHVAFYERRTLEFLARRHGVRYHRFGPLHLFTEKELPAWKLRLVRALRPRWLWRRVRRGMRSRTMDDHDLLASRGATG